MTKGSAITQKQFKVIKLELSDVILTPAANGILFGCMYNEKRESAMHILPSNISTSTHISTHIFLHVSP